jgi:hypothetical protein
MVPGNRGRDQLTEGFRRKRSNTTPEDDLLLQRVMPHHRAAWRVERIGWAIGSVALIAAMLGLFGYGPMSRTTVGTHESIQVEYDQFQRSSAPTDYVVTANAALARAGRLRIRFDQSLVEQVEFNDIVPEPEHVLAGRGYTEFEFDIAPGREARVRIVFRFRPITFGHRGGQVVVSGAPPVTLDQYIYP